jgi:hypothetical protein
VMQDHPLHHTDLFLGLLESGCEIEELQIGLRCQLQMSVFNSSICEFPCANLRRLELSLSIPENDYDDTLAYVNCPIRREDIFRFATLMARAKNLEHLLLHLASVLPPEHT